MNYKELKLKEEKLNSEVENQGNYTAQSVEKIDKSKINMNAIINSTTVLRISGLKQGLTIQKLVI